ncbi:MAG: glycosyltransferase [Cellulosilyticaceae bacterium]
MMDMEIAIDGIPLAEGSTEIRHYGTRILESLKKEAHVHIHPITTPTTLLKDQGICLYHCLNNGFSIDRNKGVMGELPVLCTIHTMIPYTHPHLCKPIYSDKFKKAVKARQEEGVTFCTTSFALQKEITKYLGIQAEVIYPRLEPYYHKMTFDLGYLYLRGKFKIEKPYVLYIGDLHERKQIIEMLQFFACLHTREKNLKCILLTIDTESTGSYKEKVQQSIQMMGLQEAVYMIHTYNDYDKLYFYNEALCFLEFGVDNSLNGHLLEAKACGCTILCSKTEVHQELLGNEGYYCDLSTLGELMETQDMGIELTKLCSEQKTYQSVLKETKNLMQLYTEQFQ